MLYLNRRKRNVQNIASIPFCLTESIIQILGDTTVCSAQYSVVMLYLAKKVDTIIRFIYFYFSIFEKAFKMTSTCKEYNNLN